MVESTQPPQHHRGRLIGGIVLVVVIAIVVVGALAVFLAPDMQEQGVMAEQALQTTTVDESTLPQNMAFRTVAGHIVLDAGFNGSDETVPLILDSGAPTTYSDDLAERFASGAVGTISEEAIDGSILQLDVVPVNSLEVGGAVFQDVVGIKGFLGVDNPLSCINSDGLIGSNLMTEAVWQIDYTSEEITIALSIEGLDHIEGAIVLEFTPATSASPSPVFSIGAGDGGLVFVLDTGSDGGLSVNPADLEAVGLAVDPSGPTISAIGAGMAGTFESQLTYAAVDLEIGDKLVSAYPVATIDTLAAGQGNIGGDFLDDFVTTIDWPNRKVYLDPIAPDGSIPPPDLPPAATVSWDGENVIVGSVAQGSTAAEGGLKPGDVVTSIDGISYEAATRDDFCELMTASVGAPETSVIETEDGQSHDIGPIDGFFDSLGS